MRQIAPIQHNYIKYVIQHGNQRTEGYEPDNWQTSNKEIARSKQYHGMLITLSDAIIFSGELAQFIYSIFIEKGVIAVINVTSYIRDGETDEWEEEFAGDLDLSTHEYNDGVFSCKLNSDEVTKKIQSRYQTKVDIDNDETLDGIEHQLGRVARTSIRINDRKLQGQAIVDIGTPYKVNGPDWIIQTTIRAVLFTSMTEGYNGDVPTTYAVQKETLSEDDPTVDNLFFYNQQDWRDNNDEPISNQVTFNIKFKARITFPAGTGATKNLKLRLNKYDITTDDETEELVFDLIDQNQLLDRNFADGEDATISFEQEVTENCYFGQGFVFLFHFFGLVQVEDWQWEILESSITVTGETRALPTSSRSLMPFPLFERMSIMMGAVGLKSDYLNSSRLSLQNGFMIRNVPNKPISFTFQRLYNSFDAIEPLGLQVSANTLKIEKREYFYQRFLSYDFGAGVDNVMFKFDKETAYSEINLGFETSNFSLEDALDEYAVRTTWVSPINTYKKELNAISNFQASSYVIENLRRIQYLESVDRTHSRRGDSTVFFIELEDLQNTPRLWQSDFEVAPTNVLYPDFAYNLRLTPMNTLRNHGEWITHGYSQFTDRSMTFSSSTGATSMVTTPPGEDGWAEDDSIVIADLNKPRFISEKVTFNLTENLNLWKILNEKIDGVSKSYGEFQFEYNNYIVRGYLLTYRPEQLEIELQVVSRTIIIPEPTDAEPPTGTPPTIGILSIDSVGETSIDLSWTEATNNSGSLDYKIYWSANGSDFDSGTSVGNVLSYNYTGLESGVQYWFKITALDASEIGLESEFSNTVTDTTTIPPLEIPTGIILREI